MDSADILKTLDKLKILESKQEVGIILTKYFLIW